jgi:uncharacterized membrane protein
MKKWPFQCFVFALLFQILYTLTNSTIYQACSIVWWAIAILVTSLEIVEDVSKWLSERKRKPPKDKIVV